MSIVSSSTRSSSRLILNLALAKQDPNNERELKIIFSHAYLILARLNNNARRLGNCQGHARQSYLFAAPTVRST